VQHEETEESEESEEEEEEEAGVRRSSRRTRVQVFFPLKKLSYFLSLDDFVEVAKSSVSDPDRDLFLIQSGQWIRIRIQEGKNDPQKQKKVRNYLHILKFLCSILRAEIFSCSSDVLYGGLGL
jgi:hypothetical protein